MVKEEDNYWEVS